MPTKQNIIFAVGAVVAMSLLAVSIGENALAASSEIRVLVDLNPEIAESPTEKVTIERKGQTTRLKSR